MRNITMRYANGVLANDNVNFSLEEGEIHAIAGENGAGKSTVMKILCGAQSPTSGEIRFCGEPVQVSSPKAAAALGIGMVYQHFMLVNEFPVYQNIFLGAELCDKRGVLDKKRMIQKTRELSEKYDMAVDPEALCGALPVGVAQKVEILKALARGSRLLILDEPTAVLTPQETEQLFAQLRKMREDKRSIVIITHKLKEIAALCDRVTIMRQGKDMGTYRVSDVTEEDISRLMVGSGVSLTLDKPAARPGEVLVRVKDLTVPGAGGKNRVDHVSFQARRGEILCLAGVEGNGQQQVVECLTAISKRYSGEIQVMGRDLRQARTWDVRAMGVSHIPEDRMAMGTDQNASILENLIAVCAEKESRLGLVPYGALARRGERQMQAYAVKGSLRDGISSLSGGNMQKVVIARELEGDPAVVVADQPTRGVDVGAIAFIHRQLVRIRDQGSAVILVSADMAEVFNLADRILVFHEGEIAAEITDVKRATEEQLGRYMLGLERSEVSAIEP